jgi:hypothetical protein
MKLRVGYELTYDFPQPTPMILMLHIHHTRASDIIVADHLTTNPLVPITAYRDGFGNWCSRLVSTPGQMRITSTALLHDMDIPIQTTSEHASTRLRICRMTSWFFCSEADIAILTDCPRSRGSCLVARRRDGLACRRSATSFTTTSYLTTHTLVRPEPPGRHSRNDGGCAVISHIWP